MSVNLSPEKLETNNDFQQRERNKIQQVLEGNIPLKRIFIIDNDNWNSVLEQTKVDLETPIHTTNYPFSRKGPDTEGKIAQTESYFCTNDPNLFILIKVNYNIFGKQYDIKKEIIRKSPEDLPDFLEQLNSED